MHRPCIDENGQGQCIFRPTTLETLEQPPCGQAGKRQDIPCSRAVNPPIRSRGQDNVHTTSEKAACLHDATSAFDHQDNLDGQSDKQGNPRTDRAAIYGRSSDQKESSVDWTTPEDVIRQTTKAGSLLSTFSQKYRAPSSPDQGYHHEKPEAERRKGATFKRRKQSLSHGDRQHDERQVRVILFRRPI